jgi:periplasmic divalent cation tolerance protein
MTEKNKPILVIVTAPDNIIARKIASALIEKEIAACVNISPSWTSVYRWEGEVQEDVEVLMFIKTRAGIFESKLVPCIQELHPYDLPEIIALPIKEGEPNYLEWIVDSVKGK